MEFNAAQEFQYDGDTSLYEDEETQQFYEKLLDLRAIIPQILLKDTPVVEEESDGGENETDKSMSDHDHPSYNDLYITPCVNFVLLIPHPKKISRHPSQTEKCQFKTYTKSGMTKTMVQITLNSGLSGSQVTLVSNKPS